MSSKKPLAQAIGQIAGRRYSTPGHAMAAAKRRPLIVVHTASEGMHAPTLAIPADYGLGDVTHAISEGRILPGSLILQWACHQNVAHEGADHGGPAHWEPAAAPLAVGHVYYLHSLHKRTAARGNAGHGRITSSHPDRRQATAAAHAAGYEIQGPVPGGSMIAYTAPYGMHQDDAGRWQELPRRVLCHRHTKDGGHWWKWCLQTTPDGKDGVKAANLEAGIDWGNHRWARWIHPDHQERPQREQQQQAAPPTDRQRNMAAIAQAALTAAEAAKRESDTARILGQKAKADQLQLEADRQLTLYHDAMEQLR